MAISSIRHNYKSVAVTGNKTLTAADSGVVQDVQSDATITLPSTAAGLTFTVHVGLKSDGNAPTVTVAPAAADGVTGNGYTATINKALSNTGSHYGDLIVLRGTGTAGVTAWIVDSVVGTWNRAA